MNDFLSFRKMITPLFIQVIFWITVIIIVLSGLFTMATGGSQGVFTGLIMIVLGPLFARIYCELLIILFRIYDELVAIRTGAPPSQQGFPVMPAAPQYVPPPAPGQYPPPPPPGQYPPAR